MGVFATWAGLQTVDLGASLFSDPVALSPALSASINLVVIGTAPSGISGAFRLQGSNGGTWADIPDTAQSVLVGSGMSLQIVLETGEVAYASVRVAWLVGANVDGSASGQWGIAGATPSVPTAAAGFSGIPASAQLAGVDFMGRDWSVNPDLNWRVVTGYQNVGEAMIRRLSTPRGGLFYDPNYGTDLREWVNQGIRAKDVPRLAGLIAQECEKDDRVYSAVATIDTSVPGGGFAVSIFIVTIAGPFTLDLTVTQLGVAGGVSFLEAA